MKERRITADIWQHVAPGMKIPDGFGGYKSAPVEDGMYTLYEIADDHNQHIGWEWVREVI